VSAFENEPEPPPPPPPAARTVIDVTPFGTKNEYEPDEYVTMLGFTGAIET
jgi:hypothetical protein